MEKVGPIPQTFHLGSFIFLISKLAYLPHYFLYFRTRLLAFPYTVPGSNRVWLWIRWKWFIVTNTLAYSWIVRFNEALGLYINLAFHQVIFSVLFKKPFGQETRRFSPGKISFQIGFRAYFELVTIFLTSCS